MLPAPMPPLAGAAPRSGAERLLQRVYGEAVGMRDLDLMRLVGRPVVVTFQGDDVRQGDVCLLAFVSRRALACENRAGPGRRRARITVPCSGDRGHRPAKRLQAASA